MSTLLLVLLFLFFFLFVFVLLSFVSFSFYYFSLFRFVPFFFINYSYFVIYLFYFVFKLLSPCVFPCYMYLVFMLIIIIIYFLVIGVGLAQRPPLLHLLRYAGRRSCPALIFDHMISSDLFHGFKKLY